MYNAQDAESNLEKRKAQIAMLSDQLEKVDELQRQEEDRMDAEYQVFILVWFRMCSETLLFFSWASCACIFISGVHTYNNMPWASM